MEPRLTQRSPLQVTGMKILTKPMSPEIPQLWPRFVDRIAEIGSILEPQVSYGVMEMKGGEAGGLSYMAAVSVSISTAAPQASAQIPEGMTTEEIPGGLYAVFDFPLSDVGAGFGYIYETWLPASGYVQAESPTFERYDEKFDPTVPSSRMEVYIPIRPSGAAA